MTSLARRISRSRRRRKLPRDRWRRPSPSRRPRRHRPPGIRFEDLPAIDIVLVSHNHYDHCDVATLRRLEGCKIITPLGNAALLKRHGISATELDWWQSSGRIPAVPAQHFSARGLTDRNRNLWGGFVIASRTLKVTGVGESSVEERLGMLVRSTDPTVATYAKRDGIHVRLTTKATSQAAAAGVLDPMEAQIRGIFGTAVYGVDDESLARGAATLLAARGWRLAIVEEGTNGFLTAELAPALRPELFAGSAVRPADAEGWVVGQQHALDIVDGADATSYCEGDKNRGRGALDQVKQRVALPKRGGDIKEDDIVGALPGSYKHMTLPTTYTV